MQHYKMNSSPKKKQQHQQQYDLHVYGQVQDYNHDPEENEILLLNDKPDVTIRYLREAYDSAKARSNELRLTNSLPLTLKGYSQLGQKIYSAMATLLYASISQSKTDELEKFVRKKASQIPNSLFDLSEWSSVMEVARALRQGENNRVLQENRKIKLHVSEATFKVNLLYKKLTKDFETFKDEISSELTKYRETIFFTREKLLPEFFKQITELKAHLKNAQYENNLLKQNMESTDKLSQTFIESKLASANSTIRTLENELSVRIQQQKDEYEAKLSETDARIKKLEKELEEKSRQEIALLQSHNDEKNALVKQYEDRFSLQLSEKQLESKIVQNNISRFKEEIESKDRFLASQVDANQKLSQRVKELEESLAKMNACVERDRLAYEKLLVSREAAYVANVAVDSKISDVVNREWKHRCSELQNKLSYLSNQIQDVNNRDDKSQTFETKAQIENLQTEIKQLRNINQTQAGKLQALEKQVASLQDELDALDEERASQLHQQSLALDQLNKSLIKSESRATIAHVEMEKLHKEMSELACELDKLDEERAEQLYEKDLVINTLKSEAPADNEIVRRQTKMIDSLSSELKEKKALEKQLTESKREIDKLRHEVTELTEKNDELDELRASQLFEQSLLIDNLRKQGSSEDGIVRRQSQMIDKLTKERDDALIQSKLEIRRLSAIVEEISNERDEIDAARAEQLHEQSLLVDQLRKQLNEKQRGDDVLTKSKQEIRRLTSVVEDLSHERDELDEERATQLHEQSREIDELKRQLKEKQQQDEALAKSKLEIRRLSLIVEEVTNERDELDALRAEQLHEQSRVIDELKRHANDKQGKDKEEALAKSKHEIRRLTSIIEDLSNERDEIDSLRAEQLFEQSKVIDELKKGNDTLIRRQTTLELNLKQKQLTNEPSISERVDKLEKQNQELRKSLVKSTLSHVANSFAEDAIKNVLSHYKNPKSAASPPVQHQQMPQQAPSLSIASEEHTPSVQPQRLDTNNTNFKAGQEYHEMKKQLEERLHACRTSLYEKTSLCHSKDTIINNLKLDLDSAKKELLVQKAKTIEYKTASVSPRTKQRSTKLTAIVRGFLARNLIKKIRIHHAAKSSGVLIAMKKTVQGETGWYCAPDGSIYYFVLNDGDWILTCGPVTREKFEETVKCPGSVKSSSSGHYLKKCDIELTPQAMQYEGEVYMSTSTWKLYFVINVIDLMI